MQRFPDLPACSSVGHSISIVSSINYRLISRAGCKVIQGSLRVTELLRCPISCSTWLLVWAMLRRHGGGEHQSTLHRARLEHQLNDSGARLLVVQANVAETASRVVAKTGIERIILTEIADLHPVPKRWLVNAVVKHVKKMVPKVSLPNVIKLTMSLKKARKRRFHRSMSVSQTLRCFSTPAGPQVLRRAPCCHTVISWPTSCSSTVSLKPSALR